MTCTFGQDSSFDWYFVFFFGQMVFRFFGGCYSLFRPIVLFFGVNVTILAGLQFFLSGNHTIWPKNRKGAIQSNLMAQKNLVVLGHSVGGLCQTRA